ncbi:MAG TPA: HDOD domain-containing protein [Acidiferrobacteraceae bacterium]|nr:HDOD domain-containing protein [Acidiferrobacteraceae bacterium]
MSDLIEKYFTSLTEDLENDRLVLPILPEVAIEVRKVVEDENATAGQVADIVCTDPALTARLLAVVNSPLYRGTAHISHVQHAVSRLGMTIVTNLVLSLIVKQLFQGKSGATAKRLHEVWEHSTQVASISFALATQFTSLDADQALLAGLIHDIGKIPLITYAEKQPELQSDSDLFDKVVNNLHPRLGATLLEKWGLDDDLISVAGGHESISRISGAKPDYVDLVIVANLQSHVGSTHPLASVDFATVPAFAKLGLDPEVSCVDIAGVAENAAAAQEMLSLG